MSKTVTFHRLTRTIKNPRHDRRCREGIGCFDSLAAGAFVVRTEYVGVNVAPTYDVNGMFLGAIDFGDALVPTEPLTPKEALWSVGAPEWFAVGVLEQLRASGAITREQLINATTAAWEARD